MRSARVLTSTGALLFAVFFAGHTPAAQPRRSQADEFIAWFGDPTRHWLATAHLQQIPEAAIPRLLEPGRAVPGPHGKMTPALLTLAKIGESAVPAVEARIRTILSASTRDETGEAVGLIDVLRAIGPPAIPSLVAVSEMGSGWTAFSALDAIVRMEPRTNVYGQVLSPWTFWTPADDRLVRLERAVVPLLPRVEKVMKRAIANTPRDHTPPHRPAAYLLARWGTGTQPAIGLRVLDDLARSSPFHLSIDAIRDLHALRAPGTAAAIRLAAPRVPTGNELTGAYLLRLAIGLYQLGDRDYGPLVDDAIRTGRPTDRVEAATFLGETGDFTNVPRLVAMLSDRTSWSGRVVADVALEALRRLTLQDLAADGAAWLEWYSAVRDSSRGAIVEQWLAEKRKVISKVPIWEANAWIARAGAIRTQSLLPIIHDYLRRKDLDSHATGMGRGTGRGGGGPPGMYGPAVVTLLLDMAQAGVPGSIPALRACLDAADRDVRMFGALALGAYELQRAADRLARELNSAEAVHRKQAGELLLELGDARGIPSRLEAMERGAAMFGDAMSRDDDFSRGLRMFACRDLRVFSQQPLPCDPRATGDALGQQVAAWRAWWESRSSPSPLAVRQARLDLEVQYTIRPVTIGDFVAR